MTRHELNKAITPIIDHLDDLGLDEMVEKLAEIIERLTNEGVEG